MNKIREKLARGETVIKVNPNYPSPRLVEFLGQQGFDAVFLDCEHGNLTIDMVEDMARGARVAGISSIVRPEDNQRHLIIRYLDCGVDGIMVPHVHTADDARRVVDAVRYGRFKDHQDKFIIAMIEAAQAVKNLPEIVKVEGLDLLFIGPGDLSSEMGHHGQHSHPEVMAAREYATKTILEAGKPVGTLATWENARSLVDSGVHYLYIHATTFLARGASQFRELVSAVPSRA